MPSAREVAQQIAREPWNGEKGLVRAIERAIQQRDVQWEATKGRRGGAMAACGGLILATFILAGCSSIEGGQARTSESSVVVRGRGMEIEVRGEEAATTQPSAAGFGKMKIGPASAGELGAVTLTSLRRNWLLGLAVLGVYAALAAGCWLLRWPVRCAMCAVLGVVGLLWPIPAILAGAALVGIVIWRQSQVSKQLVQGVDEGLSILSPMDQVAVKLRLAGAQDETAKALVRKARGKT